MGITHSSPVFLSSVWESLKTMGITPPTPGWLLCVADKRKLINLIYNGELEIVIIIIDVSKGQGSRELTLGAVLQGFCDFPKENNPARGVKETMFLQGKGTGYFQEGSSCPAGFLFIPQGFKLFP